MGRQPRRDEMLREVLSAAGVDGPGAATSFETLMDLLEEREVLAPRRPASLSFGARLAPHLPWTR